ncbi:ubiquitin carboxyl-terminal hydrolase 35 [Neodiprion fabricii]|uniref:ubiquitin carboxyl-terminal hydrolase 35 n=1 Tax=Neodiprion fabricii TaxID=2872261 RepID=UPI001ED92FC2|nr:ubiquitin carboxyl-terminal hydrolase 35 [Neodiprion fabricii]XP_046411679.1 ubiquitin carboxyl-terminal hydrolase 35 [Neodiprion fabricii]
MENGDEITIELEKCFRLILSGTRQDVVKGWSTLELLERIEILLKDGTILRGILNGQLWVSNYSEIPRLLTWFSKYFSEDTFERCDPLTNNVAVMIKNSATTDIAFLVSIIDVLLSHKFYLPMTSNHTKLCEAIIVRLAYLQVPSEPKKISEFNENASKVQKFLTHLCSNEECSERVNLIITCFAVFYNIISDMSRTEEPGPALVIVLQLVDAAMIPQAVQYILSESRNDQQLVQALKILCSWSTKWLRGDRLGIWIMEFILELEAKSKFSILKEVTEATVERLFIALLLPMGRQNLSSIVFHVLKKQSTPSLFHKISKRIQPMMQHLLKDTSPMGKECVQNIVDVSTALMIRFPGYPFYDFLQNSLPVKPRMQVVQEIVGGSVWADDLYNLETPSFRSNAGKVGLTNLGNTCYMNSVLQALFMTRQFCYKVLNRKEEGNEESVADQHLLRKLENLFALLLYSKRMSLAPTEILFASRPTYFTPGQQQDSSEFLCHLLDVLYEQEKTANIHCTGVEMTTERKSKGDEQMSDGTEEAGEDGPVIKRWTTEEDLTEGVVLQRKTQSLADFTQREDLGQTQQLNDSHSNSTDSGIQSVGGEEGSMQAFLVHRVFGGESEITYQCAQCDTNSHNTDKFRDLQLCFPAEIPENQEISVQDLINYYLTPEKLTGENKYRCDKCTKLCDAQRLIKILQAPSHLILTLKHFHYDTESRLRTKLRHKVMYNETIKVPVSSQNCVTTETYNLYAAVVHSGYSMDYGHYFTYACDAKNTWHKFNDSYVWSSSLDDFKSLEPPDTPYILFYAKNSPTSDTVQSHEDVPELSTLKKRLQELVAIDTIAYKEELRQQTERKRNQRSKQPLPNVGRHDNSDDENPPPSNCRSAVDIPTNRFLF